MIHRWDQLTFLHWPYEPEIVQALLPDGLSVETYGGNAWVGLVPFRMEVRLPRAPAAPWLSHFPETNVRTYVTAPDGTTGVWFLSLDAARLPAVVGARATYRLPYFWSAMSLDGDHHRMSYRCVRRWPGPRRAGSTAEIAIGQPYQPDELTDFDHYLTARWRLYSEMRRGGLRSALAQHDPWLLHRAEVIKLDDDLVRASGLPAPKQRPIVHWSPGVEVRIGLPGAVSGRSIE